MKLIYSQGFPKIITKEDEILNDSTLDTLCDYGIYINNFPEQFSYTIEAQFVNQVIENFHSQYLLSYLELCGEKADFRVFDYSSIEFFCKQPLNPLIANRVRLPSIYLCFYDGIKSTKLFKTLIKSYKANATQDQPIYIRISNNKDYRIINRVMSIIFGSEI